MPLASASWGERGGVLKAELGSAGGLGPASGDDWSGGEVRPEAFAARRLLRRGGVLVCRF